MIPGTEYISFNGRFEAQEPTGKGRLLALVLPEDFEIERFIAPPGELTKGFHNQESAAGYLMRLVRQIEIYKELERYERCLSERRHVLLQGGIAQASYRIEASTLIVM